MADVIPIEKHFLPRDNGYLRTPRGLSDARFRRCPTVLPGFRIAHSMEKFGRTFVTSR